MLAKRLLYIFSCLFCYVLTTVSQNLPYRLVNTIHLSPADECRWMMFDHGGLMWLGTSSGLKSWDGYDFQNFRSTAFSPGILPNNTVLSITEDNNKILWLGTRNGLARFDMKTRSFNTLFIEGDSYRTIYTLYTSFRHYQGIWSFFLYMYQICVSFHHILSILHLCQSILCRQ